MKPHSATKNTTTRDTATSSLTSYSFRLLGRRDHSRQEMRQKLLIKSKFLFPKQELPQQEIEELVTKVLDYFEEEQLQSDSKFAAAYIRQAITKGWGPIKISYKLKQKGLTNDIINSELNQDDDFWATKIQELVANKYTTPFANIGEQSKCQRFLMSRGFVGGHIFQVLRDLSKSSRK